MNNTIRTIGAHVLSLAVHVGAIGILFVVAVISPPKKLETIKVQLVSAAELAAVPDAPPAPARPEPPAATPEPEPEPPAPEPPAPEPEPPPPPKPVVTPPPEPPKAPPSKPPAPEPPKPKPVKSHRESLRERLAAAETKTAAPQPTTPRSPAPPRRSEAELAESFTRGIPKSGTTVSGTSPAAIDAQKTADEMNYAEQVVRPLFYARWQQPSRGELQQSWPTPVEVTFTVLADGRIAGWKLTKRSNSDAMNRSVEALMRQTTQLTPFSQLGIRSASLRIVVSMELGARI
ncbi:MAG: TonB C-terminal domain-containing protein [Lentisphaeria bacterium]